MLLLSFCFLAAEWATSNRCKCISWGEIIFFHCLVFCDEPLLLIQCATGDLFGLFILFIVLLKKALPECRGIESWNILAGSRFSQNGSFSCFSVLGSFKCPGHAKRIQCNNALNY